MDADARLAEIDARAAAADSGPWTNDHWEIHSPAGWVGETCNVDNYPASVANATFIAHARADVAWLLQTVAELRAQVQELTAENQDYEQGLGLNEAA